MVLEEIEDDRVFILCYADVIFLDISMRGERKVWIVTWMLEKEMG